MDITEWNGVKYPLEITHRKLNSNFYKETYCHLKNGNERYLS